MYYGRINEKTDLLTDGPERISGIITGIIYNPGFSSSFYADIVLPGGEKIGCVLECPFSAELTTGQSFSVSDPAVTRVTDDYSLFADGIYLTVSVPDEYSLTAGSISGTFGLKLAGFRAGLSGILQEKTGGEEGRLAACMLLGDKSLISKKVKKDFSRSGISHLLSVSGMHMSVLVAVLTFLFQKAGVPKKLRLLLLMITVLLYSALLGFPLSAVRSAVMLVCGYIGFFSGSGGDGPTSLGIAVIIILFIRPAAVCDISFILTVLSTLGIVTVGSYLSKLKRHTEIDRNIGDRKAGLAGKQSGIQKMQRRMLYPVLALFDYAIPAFFTCIAANIFTLLPVSFYFGEISKMTPLSGILLTLPAYAVLLLSLLCLAFVKIPVLSGFFAHYLKLSASFLLNITGKISGIRDISLSLKYSFVPYILIPMTVLSALLLAVKLPKKLRFLILLPLVCSIVAYPVCLSSAEMNNTAEAYFVSVSDNDAFAVIKDGHAVIGDISSGAASAVNEAVSLIKEKGVTEIEVLVFTHLHTKHNAVLYKLLSKETVRRVWIPYPGSSDEAAVALSLISTSSTFGCEVSLYSPGEDTVIFDGITLTLSGPKYLARSAHPAVWVDISGTDGKHILYLGKSSWEADFSSVAHRAVSAHIISGSHGPVSKPFIAFDSGRAFSYYPAYASDGLLLLDQSLLRYYVPPGGPAFDKTALLDIIVGAASVTPGFRIVCS